MKIKVIIIILLSITMILTLNIKSNATINPDDWKPNDVKSEREVNEKVGTVLGSIRNIGIVVSVICLMIIGIRAMFGSVEEKSEYKESLPGFVTGVIILLACTTIPSILYQVASKFNNV